MLNYDDDDYSQGFGHNKEAFKALTKYDILNDYISDKVFRSSDEGNDIGYSLYVFDKRYQKKIESAQPVKIKYKFSGNVPPGTYGYALVLTNFLVSISSNGHRHFDLI